MDIITKKVLICLMFVLSANYVFGQAAAEPEPMVINLDEIDSDSRREEIQRYFGYENLFCRYLTIPYDTSINTNQKGRYIDIGYGIIAVLPLMLMGLLYRRKKAFYATGITFVLYLSLCFSYSYVNVNDPGLNNAKRWGPEWANYIQNVDKPIGESMLAGGYHILSFIAKPLINIAEKVSGDNDHITYPVLNLILLLALFLIAKSKTLKNEMKMTGIIFVTFGFLWVILSGGIIWYGFLLFPLCYSLVLRYVSDDKFHQSGGLKVIKNILLFALISWVSIAYVGRISNINFLNSNVDNLGKGIVDHNIFPYSAGVITKREAQQQAYRNIGNTLDEINSNDALIYQLGTSMAFDIKNNPNRLYLDAQLVQFFAMIKFVKDPELIMKMYKAAGIRYMIIDLYTFTLDQTPEQSLRQKYTLLLNALYKNPRVRLMATDRVIKVTNPDGSTINKSAVFGKDIVDFGRYAIFEII